MSELKVEVVKIESATPHPNADRLDLIKLEGMWYQVITGRNNLKPGQLAFYFPTDSVIPEIWVRQFDIAAYYSKRLRATKLRGIFSEGLLISVSNIFDDTTNISVGDDYTEYFGVTKYEPPVSYHGCGVHYPVSSNRFPSPEHLKKYQNIFTIGEEVVITEKIHGSNFLIKKELDGEIKIASHNCFWEDSEDNRKLPQIRLFHQTPEFSEISNGVTIYGEVYGNKIQDLTYGLSGIDYAIFAVIKDSKFLDYDDFVDFCTEFKLNRVPELYRGAYSYEKVLSYNNTNSVIFPTQISEGVCVLPIKERVTEDFGERICMKFVSDAYLLRKNPTEYK